MNRENYNLTPTEFKDNRMVLSKKFKTFTYLETKHVLLSEKKSENERV